MLCSVTPLNERLLQQDLLARLVVSRMATLPEGDLPVYVLDTNVEFELTNKSPIELTPRILVSVFNGRVHLALLILEASPLVVDAMTTAGKTVGKFFLEQKPLVGFCFDMENDLTLPLLFGRKTSGNAYKVMLCEETSHGEKVPNAMSIAASLAECLTLNLPSSEVFKTSNDLFIQVQL